MNERWTIYDDQAPRTMAYAGEPDPGDDEGIALARVSEVERLTKERLNKELDDAVTLAAMAINALPDGEREIVVRAMEERVARDAQAE